MKRFAIILTVLISCLSFAAFQNNVKFTEQPFTLSYGDYVINSDGDISIESDVKSFSNPVSDVSKMYDGDSEKWINSEQLLLEEFEEKFKAEKQTSWIDFPMVTNSKIEYTIIDNGDLEFMFKSNETYYEPDLGGEPLPSTMISIALGCSVIVALGTAKKKN